MQYDAKEVDYGGHLGVAKSDSILVTLSIPIKLLQVIVVDYHIKSRFMMDKGSSELPIHVSG